jgi:hypothetical protein
MIMQLHPSRPEIRAARSGPLTGRNLSSARIRPAGFSAAMPAGQETPFHIFFSANPRQRTGWDSSTTLGLPWPLRAARKSARKSGQTAVSHVHAPARSLNVFSSLVIQDLAGVSKLVRTHQDTEVLMDWDLCHCLMADQPVREFCSVSMLHVSISVKENEE